MEHPGTAMPPHGPMGLQEIPIFLLWGDFIAWGVLLAVVLVLSMLWMWKRRSRQAALRAKHPDLEAEKWQNLESRLQTLDSKVKPVDKNLEQFCLGLSFILRQALEWRLGVQATRQTLPELHKSLQLCDRIQPQFRQEVLAFFQWADSMKFAGFKLVDQDETQNWYHRVQTWVRKLQEGQM